MNGHIGSSFDDFLKEEGILEEVNAIARQRVLSSIFKADTYEKTGEFWDTHDFTNFDDPNAPDVEFEITASGINRTFRELDE